MTKEAALIKVTICSSVNQLRTEKDVYFQAMEVYATQRAIEFKEWQDENLEDKNWENYDGHDTWINPHTRQVKSTSQLYDLYKSQKDEPKSSNLQITS